MAYLAPIHKPSSIRHAVRLKFFDGEQECLVAAKANTLDFYSWTGNSVMLQCSTSIHGTVTMLERIRPVSAQADHLFVGTDQYMYFTISWDQLARKPRTEQKCVNLAQEGARDTQTGQKCLVDPTGRFVVLEYLSGVLHVVPVLPKAKARKKAEDQGNIGDPVPGRIPEMLVRSLAFLHGSEIPKLALLWEDSQQKIHLKARSLDYTRPGLSDSGSVEFSDTETVVADLPDKGARHLIPVPDPVRGLMIVGQSTITYVDDANNEMKSIDLDEATYFVAWMRISNTRYLLGDDYGKLYVVELDIVDEAILKDIHINHLGSASRATCLAKLSDEYIFVGSHQGDSQIIKADLQKSSVDVVQTIPNIAPILDFAIMDLGSRAGDAHMNEYSSGQARIVTGSGAYQDGSLRSVRSGVGLEDQGILAEIDGVRDLFSLRLTHSELVDTLLISALDETRVFTFTPDGEVEEREEYKSLILAESTLVAANVPGERIVQITPSSVRLIDAEGGTVLAHWEPAKGKSITDASANDDRILLAVAGVSLVVLDVGSDLAVVAEKDMADDQQIACVTVPSTPSDVAVIGLWQGASISVLRLRTLETLHNEVVGEAGQASVPRGVILAQVLADQPPTVLVAMADGTVVSFSVNIADYSLYGRKSIVLGTQEARLRALPRRDGLNNIFATCEHPSLIYGSEGRIVYSAVTADEAVCVCDFNTEAYPESIVVATSDELKIALIDEERRTHVRDLHVGESVRRVAYSTKLKAFGIGTIKRTPGEGTDIVKSHVKLVDEILFDLLDTFDLQEDELVESVIRAELSDDSEGNLAERFVVGTGYLDNENEEPTRGRIMILQVDQERKLRLLTELSVKGACRCLGILEGNIVATLVKTVVVYSLNHTSARPSLVKRATYRTSTAPVDLAVTGHHIAIADLMKSVSIVEYKPGKDGLPDKLDEVARHCQPTWGSAVAHVAENTFLEGDAEGNLLVLRQNRQGVTEDDKRKLELTSEMYLGEMVNRIRSISIPISPDAVVVPRAFIATVDGSLYLFALISPSKQDLLMRMQERMAEHVESLGLLPFNKYRAFKNSIREARQPFRFVDGELIERFLGCSEAVQAQIIEGLGMTLEEVQTMVESLKRLR